MSSRSERAQKLRSLIRMLTEASEVVINEWEAEDQAPASESGVPLPSNALYEAKRLMVGASGMCMDLVQEPGARLTEVACYYFLSRALHVAVEARIADVLADAGPKEGISSEVISQTVGINERKLTSVLRALCTIHIFTEVKDRHFANNRTSQPLVRNEYLRCWILLHGMELYTASDKLLPLLFDPIKTHATAPKVSAWQDAIGADLSVWEYLEQKVEGRDGTLVPHPSHQIWALGMVGGGRAEAAAVYADYPWESLGSSTIVDVGGGAGGTSLDLAKKFPNLQFVVEDRAATIKQAEIVWKHEYPEALETGRVRLVPHNFFMEQPVKGADVYFMRYILHDWPDDECVTILSSLRDAMGPTSVILVVDQVINTTVGSPQLRSAPAPLPANYGFAQIFGNIHDLTMMTCHNAMERTPEMLSAVAKRAGLLVTKIWESRANMAVAEMRKIAV